MTWVILVLVIITIIALIATILVIRSTKKECPKGRFGEDCKEVCYHGKVKNGKCICETGWKSPNCRERDCPEGYYGEGCKLKCTNGKVDNDYCRCNEGYEGGECSNKLLTDSEALPLIKDLVNVEDTPSEFRTYSCTKKTTNEPDNKYKTYVIFLKSFQGGNKFAFIDNREVKNISLHKWDKDENHDYYIFYTLVSSKKIPDDFMPGICLMSNAFPVKK